jgi:hypothetical protein
MSPPEVWGPPIWTLFHTLVEKMNETHYHLIYPQLFNVIKQICAYLPCPECSNDATMFLSKIKTQTLNTKMNFKNMLYLFHNHVNKKKNKPLFNFSNMNVYKNKNLVPVIKNFIRAYNTKGNMKLLTESFQRQFVISNFRKWLIKNLPFFYETPQQIAKPNIYVIGPPKETKDTKKTDIIITNGLSKKIQGGETPSSELKSDNDTIVSNEPINNNETKEIIQESISNVNDNVNNNVS